MAVLFCTPDAGVDAVLPPAILIPNALAFVVAMLPVVISRVLVAWFDIVAFIPVAPLALSSVSPIDILAFATASPPLYSIPVPAPVSVIAISSRVTFPVASIPVPESLLLFTSEIFVFFTVVVPVPALAAIFIPVPWPVTSIVPSVTVVVPVSVLAIFIPILPAAFATVIVPAATFASPVPATDIPIPFATVIVPLFVRVVTPFAESVVTDIPTASVPFTVIVFCALFTAVPPFLADIPTAYSLTSIVSSFVTVCPSPSADIAVAV